VRGDRPETTNPSAWPKGGFRALGPARRSYLDEIPEAAYLIRHPDGPYYRLIVGFPRL